MIQEALKLALDALENHTAIKHPQQIHYRDKAITAIKEALAQEQDIATLVTGMEVSIDVSTGDHDSGNRLFGVVDLVQENQKSKHGLILLVQEPEANFKAPAAQPQRTEGRVCCQQYDICLEPCTSRGRHLAQRTWVGLTDVEIDYLLGSTVGENEETHISFARAIEAKLKEKNG